MNAIVKVNPATSFDAEASASRAIQLASQAGAELEEALTVIADAKQEMAGGPIKVLIALRKAFDEETLDSFPRPGEKEGNNRDEISVEVLVNGEYKPRKTTWYTEFCDNLPMGKAIAQEIEYCTRAGQDKAIKTDIPEHIIELSLTGGLGRRLEYLNGRRGTFRASIKKAMLAHFQFKAVNEMTCIQAEPIWEEGKEGEEIIPAMKCIQVWQVPGEDANGKSLPVKYSKDYTVGTFLRLNPLIAEEKGGGFKNLDATLARAGQTKDEKDSDPARVVKTNATSITVVEELHRYFNALLTDRDTAEYDKLVKTLKSSKTSDETVSSFVELRDSLDDVIKAAGLIERYKKIPNVE